MIWLVGFVVYLWFLSRPLWGALEAFFWSSMELAAIRDPHIHDAAVTLCTGMPVKYDPTLGKK